MWMLVAELAIWAGIQIYNHWFAPKPPGPRPLTRDNLQLPRVEEGSPVPCVFGRCRVMSPILIYTGNLKTQLVDNSNNGAQYLIYALDMLFVAGLPMGAGVTHGNSLAGPKLHNVWIGDNKLSPPVVGALPAVAGSIYYAQSVVRPHLFGGPGMGGGVRGAYQFFGGWTDQDLIGSRTVGIGPSPIGDSLTAFANADPTQVSGFRKQMLVAFTRGPDDNSSPYATQTGPDTGGALQLDPVPATGFALGESPSVDGFSFEVSTYGDGVFAMTDPGLDFGGDADPIEVIYDILTNKWGKLGIDSSKIDMVSFLAASTTLKAEGHGYSNVHYSTENGAQAIANICAQIDACIYEDPFTGLLSIKLIRADYDPNTIPSFDTTNILEVTDYSLGNSRETYNEIKVSYVDRAATYKQAIAIAQSLANAVGQNNRRRTKEVHYPGISNATIAAAIAARDLNVVSQPLSTISLVINRDALRMTPAGVFKVTYPEYGLNGAIFRAKRVDRGQLHDNKIVIDAIQDIFPTSYAGAGLTFGILTPATPYPISSRTIIESPRWLVGAAADSGLVSDPELTHLLPLAAPNTNDAQYFVKTRVLSSNKLTGQLFYNWLVDVPAADFAGSFTLVNDVAREAEPYDTVTGVTIQAVTGDAAALIAQSLTVLGVTIYQGIQAVHDDIALRGQTLICVVRADGKHEFMAFESTTSLGGNQYRLNNVWRALMDTPALKHLAGQRGFFVHPNMVGRRGWNVNRPIHLVMVPRNLTVVGSGFDPADVYAPAAADATTGRLQAQSSVAGRCALPLPLANLTVSGDDVQGSAQGVPAIAAQYKALGLLDGGFDITGILRERLSPSLRRGDESADSVLATVAWAPTAFMPSGAQTRQGIYVAGGGTIGAVAAVPITVCHADAYGTIDLALESQDTIAAGDPRIGRGGIGVGTKLYGWSSPRVAAFAPSWRNLIVNNRWNYQSGGEAVGWTVEAGGTGTTLISSGAFSLRRLASGNGSYYMGASSGSTSPWTRAMRAPISSWVARGLTAVLVGYIKNDNADANDTGQLTIEAHSSRSSPDTNLGSASTAATIGGTAGPWTRLSTSLVLPASTVSVVGRLTAAEVATGGTAGPDTRFTDIELRIGEWGTTNGLANYSFETGTTSWTLDSGTWTTGSSNIINGPSPAYLVVGNSVANAQTHQDYAVPDGYQWGTALLTSWVEQTNLACTREVKVQALDGSNTVLATATTGAGAPGLNWSKDTVFLQLPAGTVTIRVILIGNTDGSNSPTVRFDDVVLWLAKDLAPATVNTYDFSASSVEQAPSTWQEHALAYPTQQIPTWMFGGQDFNGNEVSYSDGVARSSTISGQFGKNVGVTQFAATTQNVEVNAYPFTRGSGAGAAHAHATGLARQGLANFKLTDPFTVVVKFRIDEPGFASGCGLVGRADLTAGWGISINASGQLGAFLRGAGSTNKSVQLARNSADGAYHMAVLVNDPVAQLLWIYDEVGGASVSTASGLGAIDRVANTCHLRIGRCSDDFDVIPGQIARVFIYSKAFTGAEVAAMWGYGADPTGKITTYTRTAVAIAMGGYGALGRTAHLVAAAQVAQPYYPSLTLDGGTGYGLAVGKSCANLLPTGDFTNGASWVKDASTTLTQGIAGPTGRKRAVTVAGDASNGLKVIGVSLAASPGTVVVVFMARVPSGTPSLDVQLYDSTPTLKGTATVALTGQWERYAVTISGWTGSTATGQIRFVSHSGALTFDLSSVMHVGQGTDIPALLPLPNSTHGDYNALLTDTQPAQFNDEGEVFAIGAAMIDTPTTAAGTIALVKNGSNTKNQREILTLSTGKMRLAHTDGAASPATVNSDLAYTTFSSRLWKIRGRWCRSGMQDNISPQSFAEVAWSDDTHVLPTLGGAGRTATWTRDTTQATQLRLGTGTAAPSDLVLRSITLQAREEKLP